MNPVPVVLLDLDGVLNPFAAPDCPQGYLERELFAGEGPQRYCLAHGAWIRELAIAGELWWATGWRENANELPAAAGRRAAARDPLPTRTVPAGAEGAGGRGRGR